jgi:DNA-binding IclR family transcriptional regulator
MAEKQILRVLKAVEEGSNTSNAVAEFTGLPVSHASYYLGELVEAGLVRRTHRNRVRFVRQGRASHWYEPAKGYA